MGASLTEGPHTQIVALFESLLYPPAIAPITSKGSLPFTTASGSNSSGDRCEISSMQAKNRRNARRFRVPYSRIVPCNIGYRASSSSSTARSVTAPSTSRLTSPFTFASVLRCCGNSTRILPLMIESALQPTEPLAGPARSGPSYPLHCEIHTPDHPSSQNKLRTPPSCPQSLHPAAHSHSNLSVATPSSAPPTRSHRICSGKPAASHPMENAPSRS